MEFVEKIAVLERELRGLIRKWERFFAGDLKVPPIKDREAFYRRLRMVVDEPGQLRASDRFRLDQLQARYGTYSANWERMLREREEGVRRWVPTAGRPATDQAESPRHPEPSVAPGATRPNAGSPPTVDSPGADDLFGRWSAAKRNLGQEVRLDRTAFDAQIAAQRDAAKAKFGADVRFDVAIVDGKVKLTARRVASSDDKG